MKISKISHTLLLTLAFHRTFYHKIQVWQDLVAHLQQTPGLDNQCNMNQSAPVYKSIENSFLLIPRGGCPFVTKALHAQQLGAKMAIVMDNQEHDRRIIMKYNGYGYKVKIPCIFINFKMGQKLISVLNRTSTQVLMKISFQTIKSQKAQVVLFMQSQNRLTYYFVQQFRSYYAKIQNKINLKVVYEVINCVMCSADDCFNEGQYCSVSYEHGHSATGQLVLNQQLREQIMFEKYQDQWWDYVQCVASQCAKISEMKECSDRCLSLKTNIKGADLQNQLAQSFDFKKDNGILKRNLQTLRNAGVQSYPELTINSIKVKGTLNAQFVFDDICNTLTKPPLQCSEYVKQYEKQINVTHNYWITIVSVLILCAALFVALFIFFRRRMRKKMAQEMQGRVDDMVSKYIEFYSERKK